MNESKERKNGTILSYISIFTSVFIQLLYTPLLIRMLGSSEYGLYSLVASIISYLVVLDFGFGDAIVMYTSKYHAIGDYKKEQKIQGMFLRIFTIIGIISLVLGAIIYIFAPNIFSSSMNSMEISKIKIMIIILTINLAITFPFSVYSSIIKAYEKFTFQKIITIIHSILQPVLMIPLLFLGYKSIALTLVVTFTNFLVLFSNYYYCIKKLNIKVKYKGFDKKIFKMIFSYSFFIFLNMVVDRINWSADQTILGIVSGTMAVSCYALATKLNDLFIRMSSAMSGVLFPKISKMVAKNASDEELSNEFIKTGRLQFFIIFLMTSGLVILGKEFFLIWVGEKYMSSYYVSLLLIIPISVPLIQNLGISILQAKNIHKFRSILYTFVALANILLSIPLSKAYGEIGAAAGTAISLIVGNIIIINIYYQKKAGLNVIKFWKEIFSITMPLIIPIIFICLFKKIIVLNGFAALIVYGGIYTVFYGLVAYRYAMNSYEKNILKKLFNKITLKKVKL